MFNVNKLNFNSKPHIMEPFNLLQIEAYLHRWHVPNKFGPKQGVMKKTVYRLKSPYYSNATLELILELVLLALLLIASILLVVIGVIVLKLLLLFIDGNDVIVDNGVNVP